MHPHTGTSDPAFHALGDATRRAMVAQLGNGPASVSEFANHTPEDELETRVFIPVR